MCRTLRHLCGDADVARDLTQEVFLRAARAKVRGDEPWALAWLLRVARNLLVDRARRGVHAEVPLSSVPATSVAVDDPAYARIDLETGFAQQVAGLPAAWREALMLRHMHDLPVEDVARIMDVPTGTVKTWLHRARAKLAGWGQEEDA